VLSIAILNLAATGSGAAGASALGNLLVLAAVFSEAIFIVLAKRLSLTLRPMQMATGVNLVALLAFAPLAWPELQELELDTVPAGIWGAVVWYSLSASVVAFVLWYRGLAVVEASVAGLFTAVMPVSAALAAGLLLGERPSSTQLVALLAVLAAIALAARAAPGRAAPAQRGG
jgi:drug/metabolite transporter (DMT)-like permease